MTPSNILQPDLFCAPIAMRWIAPSHSSERLNPSSRSSVPVRHQHHTMHPKNAPPTTDRTSFPNSKIGSEQNVKYLLTMYIFTESSARTCTWSHQHSAAGFLQPGLDSSPSDSLYHQRQPRPHQAKEDRIRVNLPAGQKSPGTRGSSWEQAAATLPLHLFLAWLDCFILGGRPASGSGSQVSTLTRQAGCATTQ